MTSDGNEAKCAYRSGIGCTVGVPKDEMAAACKAKIDRLRGLCGESPTAGVVRAGHLLGAPSREAASVCGDV